VFVRTTFSEKDKFGLPFPEQWLKEEAGKDRPDFAKGSPWKRDAFYGLCDYLDEDPGKVCEILAQYAKDGDLLHPPSEEHGKIIRDFNPLLEALDPSCVKFYFGLKAEVAIVVRAREGGKRRGWIFSFMKECPFDPLSAEFAIGAILKTWEMGGEKATAARGFLCGLFSRKIADIRQKAEMAFDRAVATNAYGTEIVCANRVWLVGAGDSSQSYGPDLFQGDNQIFLSSDVTREKRLPNTRNIVTWFHNTGRPQAIIREERKGKCYISLITHESLSPYSIAELEARAKQ
jgi:hypothetical protein